MKTTCYLIAAGTLLLSIAFFAPQCRAERERIKAVGLPLADHYAGIIAYEKYREQMIHADYQLQIVSSPELVRAYFRSEPDADIAYLVSPMVMDMFAQKPNFRWVSLIHRDGNALVINKQLNEMVKLPYDRRNRLPNARIAEAISAVRQKEGKPVEIAIPSPLATHTTILYKYLKDQGKTFSFYRSDDVDVVFITVPPPQSPVYLQKTASRGLPSAFEQSLPWTEQVEIDHYGTVGWYSKDVMKHDSGHVECIIIAQDQVIRDKRKALQEVINYIHKAGHDIESARRNGGKEMDALVQMVRKHIPAHTEEAIIQSLRIDLNVINYKNLNIDASAKESFREIMELALEAKFIKESIDIDELTDESFISNDRY